MPNEFRKDVDGIWFDNKLMMVGRKVVCHDSGIVKLIKIFFFKSDGEGLDRVLTQLCHDSYDQTRIDSSTQKSAQGNIANQSEPDRFLQVLPVSDA